MILDNMEIDKKGYKKKYSYDIDESVADAFNILLSRFNKKEIDKQYGIASHQILSNEQGELYYFDSTKYMFPVKKSEHLEALNANIGIRSMSRVVIENEKITIERYNLLKNELVYSIYEYKEDIENIGKFMLELSSLQDKYICKLSKKNELFIKMTKMNLLICDENKNIDGCIKKSNDSFYINCRNYLEKLNKNHLVKQIKRSN